MQISVMHRKPFMISKDDQLKPMGTKSIILRMPFMVVILACIAVLVTVYNYPLFWGIQFIFGMSVALATLFLRRGLWGLLIAIPVAIATYFMWGAPYAGISFIAEILFLTLIRNSRAGDKILRNGSILIYDFIYNALIGAPFYYLTYTYIVKATRETTLLLAQKSIVNGVMNSLIAYVIYAAITLYLNKRSDNRQSVSLQALALATVYSVIVFISLFMSDKLYGSVMRLKAHSIYEEMDAAAALVVNASTSQDYEVSEYTLNAELERKDAEVYYKGKADKSYKLFTESAPVYTRLEEDYVPATSSSRISKILNKVADGKNSSLTLYLPKPEIEPARVKRYLGGVWEANFYKDGSNVKIIQPARKAFIASGRFFENAFPIINLTIVGGIVLSIAIAYSLEKEFLTVLGKSKRRKTEAIDAEYYKSLELSPITEIRNFAKEINRRTNEINEAKARIEELNNIAQKQLTTAGEIQQAFLGDSSDVGQKPDVSLFMRPALNAGGDWYDAFDLDKKTFIIVADVCDKGVGAALFMSVFRSLIRYSAENWCAAPSETEPLDKVISSVNDYMSTEHEDMTMFATVFIGCISHPAKRLDYVLAGHEEPVFINSNGEQQSLEVSGPAIGLFPQAEYIMRSLYFDEGSILVGYSDGVVDARDPNGNSYGHQRLLDLVKKLQQREANAVDLRDEIVLDLDSHMRDAEQFDDITIATVVM